jgi:hypothetical protein
MAAHWLDDIERKESRKQGHASDSARIQDKKFRIQQNYEKNHKVYDGFVEKLHSLVDRVNNLPLEYREEYGKISFKEKDSKLNNHLRYFSSSRRTQKTEFKGLLHPLKNVHYKHVRIIYFNIAKLMDKVEVEIREEFLEKKRRDGKEVPEHENPRQFRKPESDKDKFHEIYYYEMGKLTEDLAYKILDWLAFKQNVDHIPIVIDGEPRFKE